MPTRFPPASTFLNPTSWHAFKVMANTKVVGQFMGQGFCSENGESLPFCQRCSLTVVACCNLFKHQYGILWCLQQIFCNFCDILSSLLLDPFIGVVNWKKFWFGKLISSDFDSKKWAPPMIFPPASIWRLKAASNIEAAKSTFHFCQKMYYSQW